MKKIILLLLITTNLIRANSKTGNNSISFSNEKNNYSSISNFKNFDAGGGKKLRLKTFSKKKLNLKIRIIKKRVKITNAGTPGCFGGILEFFSAIGHNHSTLSLLIFILLILAVAFLSMYFIFFFL